MNPEDIAAAVYELVDRRIDTKQHQFIQGTFVAAETSDTNLSKVNVEGVDIRFVRRLDSVTGLVAGNSIMLAKAPGFPLTILGKLRGDITDMLV